MKSWTQQIHIFLNIFFYDLVLLHIESAIKLALYLTCDQMLRQGKPTKQATVSYVRFFLSSFFSAQVAAVVLWITRGCFIVQTRLLSYRISVRYRNFIIFGCSVYGYCKDDKTVCSSDGDSSRDSSLFTKYKISIFSLFFIAHAPRNDP